MTRKTSPWTFRFFGLDNREARTKAEAALKAAGFSVGSRQRGAPSGILLGDYRIAKWRNLSTDEREQLHGKMMADEMPVIVYFPAQPVEIDDAITAMNEALITKELAHGDK